MSREDINEAKRESRPSFYSPRSKDPKSPKQKAESKKDQVRLILTDCQSFQRLTCGSFFFFFF